MVVYPYQYVNRAGIPTVKSTSVQVNGTTSVDFTFDTEITYRPYRGLVLVYLAQAIPAGTTTTLPIRLTLGPNSSNVTTYNGAALTVADFQGTGVYLFYYDKNDNVLQILN